MVAQGGGWSQSYAIIPARGQRRPESEPTSRMATAGQRRRAAQPHAASGSAITSHRRGRCLYGLSASA
jgi:hypothetical protein